MNKKLAAIIGGITALGLYLRTSRSSSDYIAKPVRTIKAKQNKIEQVAKPVVEKQSAPRIAEKIQPVAKQTEEPEQTLEEKLEPLPPREHSIEKEQEVLERLAKAGGLSLEEFLNCPEKVGVKKRDGHVVKLWLQEYDMEDAGDIGYFPQLEHLHIVGCGLRKIKGLEYCQNMKFLAVYGNRDLMEVDGLRYMKELKQLHVNANCLFKLDVSGLDELEVLIAVANQLAEVKGLNLPKLSRLYLRGNQLKQIGDLSGALNLKHVDITDNPVQDLENVKALYERGIDVKADFPYEQLKEPKPEDTEVF